MARHWGEGTKPRLRNDGRWIVQVTVGGKRRSVYGSTPREAVQKAKALVLHPPTDREPGPDLEVYLARWLATDAAARCRATTLANHERAVRRHLTPRLGHLPVEGITPAHIEDLLLAVGGSVYLREQIRSTLYAALQHAVRLGLRADNPVGVIAAPRRPRVPMRVWTPEESRQFLTVVQGDRLEALYLVALLGGLRQGEILGLEWRDVDWSGQALTVQRSIGRDGDEHEPKTHAGIRRVDMPAGVMAALKSLSRKGDRIFTAPRGGLLRARNLLERSFWPLVLKAEVPDIRFHDLRHTHATHLLLRGWNPKIVSERLGHASVEITLRIYSHVLPGLQRSAADDMARLLDVSQTAVKVKSEACDEGG